MKSLFTYYFVQGQYEGKTPEIVHYRKANELLYKFLDKKKAKKLAEEEKKANPQFKFRVVKCTEAYESDPWI